MGERLFVDLHSRQRNGPSAQPTGGWSDGKPGGSAAPEARIPNLGFVDVHSHVVPSGDDGAQSMEEGLELCESAWQHGTRVLYATPHISRILPPDERREHTVRERFDALRAQTRVELRLGWELTPIPELLDEDPSRYALAGLDAVLMELPFVGSADLLVALGEHTEEAGLLPVIAHPERTQAVLERPSLAEELAERGWPLQVNATSLLGDHGPEREALGWRLLEQGTATIVASDGHRATRPALLDGAYELARARFGAAALRLFDGSALNVSTWSRRPASRAASPGA